MPVGQTVVGIGFVVLEEDAVTLDGLDSACLAPVFRQPAVVVGHRSLDHYVTRSDDVDAVAGIGHARAGVVVGLHVPDVQVGDMIALGINPEAAIAVIMNAGISDREAAIDSVGSNHMDAGVAEAAHVHVVDGDPGQSSAQPLVSKIDAVTRVGRVSRADDHQVRNLEALGVQDRDSSAGAGVDRRAAAAVGAHGDG